MSGRKSRRILLVHSSAELYGSDKACLAIAQVATREGHDVRIILPADGPLRPRLESVGAKVTVFDALILRRADLRGVRAVGVPFQWGRAALKVRRFSLDHKNQFDVVHAHCMPSVGGLIFAKYLSVPLVWHVHEIFEDSPLARAVFEKALTSADLIVAASRSVQQQFRSEKLRDRTRVAYTGASVPTGTECVKPLKRQVPRVVCVGRLNQWKGQEVLIRSTRLLQDAGVPIETFLIGDVFRSENQFRSRLESLASVLDVTDRVHFLGQRDDAVEQIAKSDVVVVPSTRPEPFGMVVVEGMALGRPVIATDAGGPAEMITDGRDGLLVEPGSPSALASALRSLISDPEWAREMARRAPVTAAKFTPEAMALKVLDAYEEVLGKKGHPEQSPRARGKG
jgi:glycosyltransferase involved in cell wall biosynthesis